ncbi:DUF3990 domain-containing protein [Paenibacillus sp. LjRoot153]|uniref:DUF3990 domain-containing protein n=1 Tax=Paenibacillus sp. LjRoot153 TaxID=3342270 RepID=UPI003ECE1DD9
MNFGHIEMDNSLGGQLVLPRYVFHATLKEYAPALKKKVLDKSWWRKTDRDFGAAVHTTISFDQEKDWAIKAEEKRIGSIGCIIKIRSYPEMYKGFINCLVFLGETDPQWTRFIVDHRYDCDETGKDPCGGNNHPAIVIGQMADNKMDLVRDDYLMNAKTIANKYDWFYERITRDKQDRKLDALQLGNQIAFCDEGMSEMLQMESFFIYDETRKEWIEHGAGSI